MLPKLSREKKMCKGFSVAFQRPPFWLLLLLVVVHFHDDESSSAMASAFLPAASMIRRDNSYRTAKFKVNAWMAAIGSISETDASLAAWMLAFSASHIGMSAIRGSIIQSLGNFAADSAKLVGNENWKLPAFWPGDNVGKDRIFPDAETAGRQLYRALYTIVSFVTLGSALGFYLQSTTVTAVSSEHHVVDHHALPLLLLPMWTAVAANAASLSSLANASPLGLMPSFQQAAESSDESTTTPVLGRSISRNDALKFQVRGLTRITRHPLILPVVPWGIANAMVLGGKPADWIFFGGLSLYAICGCAAQDLRVSRQEGSVGTTFEATGSEKDSLQEFFRSTSFVPFGAVLDGRQSLGDIVREVPWLAVVVALPVGYVIEEKMLEWLL